MTTQPWRRAGLTDRQAAAHLLDRFTFGARPGEVERVAAMGLEKIDFFWYFRKITPWVFLGYFAGVASFLLF